jgi:hypothetical protein
MIDLDTFSKLLKGLTLQHVLVVAGGLLFALIAWRILSDVIDSASIPSIKVPLTASEFLHGCDDFSTLLLRSDLT